MGNKASNLKRKKSEDGGIVSVVLRHGGKFVMNPRPMYIGGCKSVYQEVNLRTDVSLEKLIKCCEVLGLKGEKRFFVVLEDSFKPLHHEFELLAWGWERKKLNKPIEICIVVKENVEDAERVEYEDGDSDYEDMLGSSDDDVWSSFVDHDVVKAAPGQDESDNAEDDVVVSDESDFDEKRESDEDGATIEFPIFNKEVIFNPEFSLGLFFENKELFKKAITSHAINTKRSLYMKKNDAIRVYARCKEDGCEWACTALKVSGRETFQIRNYNPTHNCAPTFHVTNLSSTWLGQKHLSEFQCDPKRNIKGWRKEVMKELNLNVSSQQAYRARAVALKIIEGEPDSQYTMLWDYAKEIRISNPGSTTVLDIDGEGKFSNFYVCFEAVKMGFRNACRPFIGVDGCWLKGPRGGILLSAVGVDPSNCIYPLAYAIVSVENRETWEWFLVMLKVDLQLGNGEGYTFMSDKQKGLILATNEVFPNAEKRFCVRHMHNNYMSAGFRGLKYKKALWRAARASTVGVFNERMKAFRESKDGAGPASEWLDEKDPAQWSKSHFSTLSKCDMLLNNVCESFNSSILDARDKPILTMLEWIRLWLMERFKNNRDTVEKWKGRLPPKITKILRKKMQKMNDCIPMKSSNRHYQVQCSDGSLFSVDLESYVCSCRQWELSGIPCKHALSAICNQRADPEMFVHDYLTVDTYKKAYDPVLLPISGQQEWAATQYIPPLPPNFGKGRGRPTKLRRMDPNEKSHKKQTKMKRQQKKAKCNHCGGTGHNKRKCKKTAPVVDVAPVEDADIGRMIDEVMLDIQTQESAAPVILMSEPTNDENEEGTRKKMMIRRNATLCRSSTFVENDGKKINWKKCMLRGTRGYEIKGKSITKDIATKVPPRSLLDEDDSEFEVLLSQANSRNTPWEPMLNAPTLTGPTPWEQLHLDKLSQKQILYSGPTMSFSSGGLRPMFSTHARNSTNQMSNNGKGKEVAK